MSYLSDEAIYEEISKIVRGFENLECDKCAQAVIQWLAANKIRGKILRIATRYRDEDFIISERLERQGIYDSITTNGKHYAVEVRGRVFDNISSEGMLREYWEKDFHCQSEELIIDELEEL